MVGDHLQISSMVRTVSTPEGAVLLQLDRGMYRSLNATGRSIWNAIDEGSTVDEIIARLSARYPAIPGERITADVHTFIANLQARGLVEEKA
jgi:hypothetical protein